MAIVIADSGPLRYLIQIDHIDLLPRLFQRVFIPPVIAWELTRSATPGVVRAWMNSMPSGPWQK
jgi:predicted nucleic acid-binding protein